MDAQVSSFMAGAIFGTVLILSTVLITLVVIGYRYIFHDEQTKNK